MKLAVSVLALLLSGVVFSQEAGTITGTYAIHMPEYTFTPFVFDYSWNASRQRREDDLRQAFVGRTPKVGEPLEMVCVMTELTEKKMRVECRWKAKQ